MAILKRSTGSGIYFLFEFFQHDQFLRKKFTSSVTRLCRCSTLVIRNSCPPANSSSSLENEDRQLVDYSKSVTAFTRQAGPEYNVGLWEPQTADAEFINQMISILNSGDVVWWQIRGIVIKFEVRLRPYHICEILKQRVSWDAALNLFYWAKDQKDYEHDAPTYNILLKILGDARKFDVVEDILDEMNDLEVPRTEVTFMTAVQSYFDAGMIEKALDIFDEMEYCTKPSARHYKYVMSKLNRCGYPQVVPLLYKNMQWVGHAPDTFTYNIVIDSLCRSGKLEDALKLYDEMRINCIRQDYHTFTPLITSLLDADGIDAAYEFIEVMIQNDNKPEIGMFNSLLETLCKVDKINHALDIVFKMVDHGFKPDAKSFSIMMSMFGRLDDVNESYRFYEELRARRVPINPLTYNTMMSRVRKAGRPDVAEKVFGDMRNDGYCKPNIYSFNIILDLLGKAGRTDETWSCFQEMKFWGCHPDRYTYNILVIRLAKAGKVDLCFTALNEMRDKGIDPNAVTYCGLIEGLSKHGEVELACKFLKEMKEGGFKPNPATLQTLVNMLRKANKIEMAETIFQESWDAMKPVDSSDPITYACSTG